MTELESRVAVFERDFADSDDLAHLTYAARRVLATAAALFARDGVEATSVRDVTSACGLTSGALYKHFASKDDLLYALVCHGHARLESRLAGDLAAAGDEPREQFVAFVGAYVRGHLEGATLALVVRREFRALSPERVAEVVRRRRGLRARLTAILECGRQAGTLRLLAGSQPEQAAKRTAVMVLDMCSRTSEWYRPDATPIEQMVDDYVAAALRLAGAVVG